MALSSLNYLHVQINSISWLRLNPLFRSLAYIPCRQEMHVLMIFLLGTVTVVFGISRISQPSFKACNFAKAIEGWKLSGSMINETKVDSERSCRLKCVEDERCQSYNFGTVKDSSGRFVCQLSDADRFVGRVNFTEVEDFRYRGIKVINDWTTLTSQKALRRIFKVTTDLSLPFVWRLSLSF